MRVDAVELAEEHPHPRRPSPAPRARAAARPRARRRARCSGSRRSRSAPGYVTPSSTSSTPSTSRSRCGGSRSRPRAPTTCSPSRSTIRRRTPCVDGWFGPKLTCRTSSLSRSSSGTSRIVGTRAGMREPSYCGSRRSASCASRSASGAIVIRRPRSGRARRRSGSPCAAGALPIVLGHEEPLEVRVAVERRSPSGRTARARASRGRPDRDDARHALALVEPSTGAARAARPAAARAGGS